MLLLLSCSFHLLYGQEDANKSDANKINPEFSTDRPGAGSDAASVMGVGRVQVETGIQYTYDIAKTGDRKHTIKNLELNNTRIRIGLLQNMEFRFDFAYQYIESTIQKDKTLYQKGFVPLSISTKISICEEKGLRPKIAVSIGAVLPSTGKKAFQVSYVVPVITFLTETTISENLSLTSNLGAEWDSDKLQSIGTYAFSADVSLSKRWGGFIEFYGTVPEQDKPEHLFDAGFVYLLKDYLQLDVSAGLALTSNAPDSFVGLGMSWMLNN